MYNQSTELIQIQIQNEKNKVAIYTFNLHLWHSLCKSQCCNIKDHQRQHEKKYNNKLLSQ